VDGFDFRRVMPSSDHQPQGGSPREISASAPPGVALFDLDGTLLAWDCQLLFRQFVVRRERWRLVYLPVFLGFLPLAPVLGKDRMKRVFLGFLHRMPADRLREHASGFAAEILPLIYPDLRQRLDAHQRAGHFTILASASPECYVAEIGERLGFDLSLGTEVRFGRFFPQLENHKGAAKVARLKRLIPETWFADGRIANCHGYTDSCADLPMLGLCGAATVVNPSPRLEGIAVREGWEILRPRRPWSGRLDFARRVLAMLLGIGRIH
jgi:phosphatidylglycerophosphatase C